MEAEKKGINPRIMSAKDVQGGKCGCTSCSSQTTPVAKKSKKKNKMSGK